MELRAVRYLASRQTGQVLAGSKTVEHRLALSWALSLTDDADPLWRLERSSDLAEVFPPPPRLDAP